MAGASPAMTIIAIAEGFGRPHPEEGAQRPPQRMGAGALFLLAMFHHARAVHVLLGVAPSILLELAGLFVARADRLRARGAHPFAAPKLGVASAETAMPSTRATSGLLNRVMFSSFIFLTRIRPRIGVRLASTRVVPQNRSRVNLEAVPSPRGTAPRYRANAEPRGPFR